MNKPVDDLELRPVCFMVMPFGRKMVTGHTGEGAPVALECTALWTRVYQPAIEMAGFIPVRADFDTGSVIVKDMFERLAYADLVLADVSLPNGNVYYELGLRHVAKKTGCVLFAAEWSRQLFDIDQFTSHRYALTDGNVPESEAETLREQIRDAILTLKDSDTPWHEFINDDAEQRRRGVFREQAQRLSDFQAGVNACRLYTDPDVARTKAEEFLAGLSVEALSIAEVAMEGLELARDKVSWQAVVAFTERLPDVVRKLPVVREQQLLAEANLGEPEQSVASLQQLIENHGETPERLGLIGGRYKRLYRAARDERVQKGEARPSGQERRLLNRAIDAYTQGMELDFNEYYCSCNIPQLLLDRGEEGGCGPCTGYRALCDRGLRACNSSRRGRRLDAANLIGCCFSRW